MGKITSTWVLKEKGNTNPISHMELKITPYGAAVHSILVDDEVRLPANIKNALQETNNFINLEELFQIFLNERIPLKKDCDETDAWIVKQLDLEKDALRTGRLTRYCGFVAVINYFQTNEDNYYVSPIKKQTYFWGFVEKGFSKLYEIFPKK